MYIHVCTHPVVSTAMNAKKESCTFSLSSPVTPHSEPQA